MPFVAFGDAMFDKSSTKFKGHRSGVVNMLEIPETRRTAGGGGEYLTSQDHLDLPAPIEPAGVLLFKLFSYLGSYPNCAVSGAVPLTLDAFITAFALCTGKLDQDGDDSLFEELFFESLAIPSGPCEEHEIKADIVEEQEKEEEPQTVRTGGLSLADLGVKFDDFDLESDAEPTEVDEGSKILSRDLIDLFVLLFWIVEMENQESLIVREEEPDYHRIRAMADNLVASISPLCLSNNDNDNLSYVSQQKFLTWKHRNAPHLFKTLQSFIYSRFAMCSQHSLTAISDIVLLQDTVSTPDISDILDRMYCSFLSWCLPAKCLQNKEWNRLYSSSKDGFSMNRFESHVFKYPGPTLLLIHADITNSGIAVDGYSPSTTIILGAFVSQPWKTGKQYWGDETCFLFELSPTFEVFRPTKRNNQYVHCRNDFGIGFGGTTSLSHPPTKQTSSLILTLDNTLQKGCYMQNIYPPLPTFENSANRKSLSYTFETINVEVFGLGNNKARVLQEKEWEFEKREALRRAGLNIRQSDNAIDKELLKMAGIIDENREER
ncbi:Restriction of telomere capping protein 5 [Apophysomyces sp. BC1034]|nr:Restriction of telomere capping protein 5 [Apophysomyces sp. BC1015]KAG0181540.1 Restriction of telomere capping protein 5 [Apophysomyces sp. BC1021]KAG0192097.1 Restriction of telomere capping protein 5 [Apophysomyces sp. BC1034]